MSVEPSNIIKVEKILTDGSITAVCPECQGVDYYDPEEAQETLKFCPKCNFIYPAFYILSTATPLPITIAKFADGQLSFIDNKVKEYKRARAEELLTFHTNESDFIN